MRNMDKKPDAGTRRMTGKILTEVTMKTVVFWNVTLKNEARYSSTVFIYMQKITRRHTQKTGTADECGKMEHDTCNDDVMNIILLATDCNVQALDIVSLSFKPASLLKYTYLDL